MISEKTVKLVTSVPGPKSLEFDAQRRQYISSGVGIAFGIYVAEAKDALIKDVDGNVFIDMAAGFGVQNAGHCDEEVVKAIQIQAARYIHPSFQVTPYPEYIELAKRLCELTPGKFPKKVMFANSGSEAVENAVKIAKRYTGKQGIVSLEAAFHGRTYMAMGLTSKVKPYKNGMGPFPSELYKMPGPYCYRCEFGSTYPECGLACVEKFRTLLKAEWSADNLAAVIAEPVQGEGGFIVPPKDYFTALSKICQENKILLIIDEVQAGFGRTGRMFASENFDLEPDLMTLSKSIAAGVPLSGVVGRAEVMDGVNKGEIGGTYGGSPLACVASLKVIDKMIEQHLPERAVVIGQKLLDKGFEFKEKFDFVGDVRGIGAMVGYEFVKDPVTKEPNEQAVDYIINYCLQKGVLLISAGLFHSVIRFLPPLVITDEQLAYVLKTLEEAMVDYAISDQ